MAVVRRRFFAVHEWRRADHLGLRVSGWVVPDEGEIPAVLNRLQYFIPSLSPRFLPPPCFTSTTMGTWRLLYFAFPTRGEQLRLLFKAAGVDFEDVRIEAFPRGLDQYRRAAMGKRAAAARPTRGLCPYGPALHVCDLRWSEKRKCHWTHTYRGERGQQRHAPSNHSQHT